MGFNSAFKGLRIEACSVILLHSGLVFMIFYLNEIVTLSVQIPAMSKANSRRKTPLEIYFIYLGNKDIYCIFKYMLQS